MCHLWGISMQLLFYFMVGYCIVLVILDFGSKLHNIFKNNFTKIKIVCTKYNLKYFYGYVYNFNLNTVHAPS